MEGGEEKEKLCMADAQITEQLEEGNVCNVPVHT